ncbi:hypothetical protein ACN47E_007051 [Coniothyrium glycines]
MNAHAFALYNSINATVISPTSYKRLRHLPRSPIPAKKLARWLNLSSLQVDHNTTRISALIDDGSAYSVSQFNTGSPRDFGFPTNKLWSVAPSLYPACNSQDMQLAVS